MNNPETSRGKPRAYWKILNSVPQLDAIAAQWRDLQSRAGRSPFTDYDIVHTWCRTVAMSDKNIKLHIVTGTQDGRLVAVLPLVVDTRRGPRILYAVGQHWYDFCDVLCEGNDAGRGAWLAAMKSRGYDFAVLRHVFPDCQCHEMLAEIGRARDELDAYYLRTRWSNSAEWSASLSGKLRGNINRSLRRMREEGPVKFEVYKDGPVPLHVIDRMVTEKITWCATNNKDSPMFSSPMVYEYYRALAEVAAANKSLFLAWLSCGDELVAYQQGFIHNSVLYGLLMTYNPAWIKLSPGTVIMAKAICWAIDNGCSSVNLGLGDPAMREEGECWFKSKFANERLACREFSFSSSLRSRILEAGFFVSRTLLRRERVRPIVTRMGRVARKG
jgi:CelD/BcsL family acetyltransferase involved in cellulose biosynthesis